jgi:branched-subunit amino acid ABC-type transport system permease component
MLELATFSLLNGVVYGLLLFMLSSGLTLIFSMMGVLNFAHASFFMLGAYFSYQAGRWIGFWPALAIAPARLRARPGRAGGALWPAQGARPGATSPRSSSPSASHM